MKTNKHGITLKRVARGTIQEPMSPGDRARSEAALAQMLADYRLGLLSHDEENEMLSLSWSIENDKDLQDPTRTAGRCCGCTRN